MDHEVQAQDLVRALLAEARSTPEVRYDVELGLARHRSLVAMGASTALTGATTTWFAGFAKIGLATLLALGAYGAYLESQSPSAPLPPAPSATQREQEPPSLASVPAAQSPAQLPEAAPTSFQEPVAAQPLPAAAPSTRMRLRQLPSGMVAVRPVVGSGAARAAERSAPAVPAPSDLPAPDAAAPTATYGTTASGAHPRETGNSASRESAALPEPESQTAMAVEDAIEREIRELAQASRLLGRDPERALAIARSSEARFHAGYLRPERQLIIVQSLVALKRLEAARQVAKQSALLSADPALAKRVRRALSPK